MTQYDKSIEPNSTTLLRDLLHLIARTQDVEAVAPTVLREAQMITGADASFFLLFNEPRVLVTEMLSASVLPDDDWFKQYVDQSDSEMYIGNDLPPALAQHYKSWIIYPFQRHGKGIGILSLLFEDAGELTEELEATLLSLIDALRVVTSATRSETRHQKLMHNQNEFVRIVSHDLRTPLTSMKGFASMLEDSMVADLNERQLYFVEKILSGIEQMTSLVDNIQDAGRYDPETGFYEMERKPTDLIGLVHSIVNTYIVPAEKGELTLVVNAADDVPIVNVDETMLERSVANLVDNAIKYTPNGGRVEVGVRVESDHIVITISDNGYGISDENLRKLFQRHFRIRRREHKRIKGSGLGLFIVRSVALQHGGDAFVESVEGEGSTFGIRIPLSGDNLFGSARDTNDA